jgi:hypothetical protein
MSKPEWATTANLSDPGEDWDGTPTRVEPSSGEKAAGFNPNDPVSAQLLNYLIGNGFDWFAKDPTFGTGQDGDVTLDGSTDYNTFSSRSGSTYTLTRDVFADDLTINTGVELKVAGFRVYVKGTLTTVGTGKISANGVAGSGINGGASSGTGTVLAGSAGGTGAGFTTGVASSNVTNGLGGVGGTGGTGAGGAGGAGGTVTAPTAASGSVYLYSPSTFGQLLGAGAIAGVRGGSGGGSGGGDNVSGQGWGGGGAGGVLCVAAETMALASNAAFEAKGGAGVAAASSAGGGGGGGGGLLFLVYREKNAVTFSAATNCTGGSGGSGAGALAGANGSNGSVVEIEL